MAADAWLPASPPGTPWGTNAPPIASGAGNVNCGYIGILSVPACANNFATIWMCAGNIYQISLCSGTTWDSFLSLTTPTGDALGTPAYDNDGCGTPEGLSTLTYVPVVSGNFRIRVRTNPCTVDAASCGTLQISISPTPAPPANDNSCGATALPVNATCEPTQATTSFATQSSGVPIPSDCPSTAAFAGYDVWFSVVVPIGGDVAVETGSGTALDIAMAAYVGADCTGPLTQLACNDDVVTPSQPNPYLLLTGQIPGDTIWIRVWPQGGAVAGGTFTICAYDVINTSVSHGPADRTVISTWPNPAGDQLFISTGSELDRATRWRITENTGRSVLEGTWRTGAVENMQVIPLRTVHPGNYILELLSGQGVRLSVTRFVKV
ncbi:MAG: hypothetical protein ABI432_15505 [Flavobacteriales bacterium]